MTDCLRDAELQDYLEGLLPPAAAAAAESHLRDCARCAAERARLEHLFDTLDALPLEAPSPAMAERVLDRVLPSRARARWIQRLGWGYAGALGASLTAVATWMALPAGRTFLAWLATAASSRLLHSLVFVMDELAFLAVRVAGGWTAVTTLHARMNPLLRALLTAANGTAVPTLLAVSAVACLAVLWWMRPRRTGGGKGMTHVGLVGF